jgi:hypothetical protein
MQLRVRLNKLESAARSRAAPPYVVFQAEGEPLDEAVERALAGQTPPPGWRYVLAPEPLTREQWVEKYSPEHPAPVENPD